MEKICLIQAGRFFIGIDAALIRSTRSIDSNAAKGDMPLLHLESFFGQQPLAALTGYVLELENESELPALLVDRVIGEIDATVRFEPLPLLYPELTATCCPQVFVDEQQVYLLLELEKIELVHEKLQTDYGFVLLSELPAYADDKVEAEYAEPFIEERVEPVVAVEELVEQPEEQEEENGVVTPVVEESTLPDTGDEDEDAVEVASTTTIIDPVPEEESLAPDDRDESSEEPFEEQDEENEAETPVVEEPTLPDTGDDDGDGDKGEGEVASTTTITDPVPKDDSPVPDDQDDSSAEQENTQPLTEISDEILQKIVSWTIGQYIEWDKNEKAVINATDLPIALIQPQGLSLTSVQMRIDMMQHIINKTVWRCEQLNETALQQLKKKYGKS